MENIFQKITVENTWVKIRRYYFTLSFSIVFFDNFVNEKLSIKQWSKRLVAVPLPKIIDQNQRSLKP